MRSVRVGRIGGIDVRVDASALVIAGLISWALSDGVLPEAAPGYATALYWVVGVVTALAFLASLLAHEVSHSVVARRRGIRVRDITLWLLGGVATIEGEPKNPRDEFAMAIAGPALSMGIGATAVLLAAVAGFAGGPDLVTTALWWLGSINIVLALFNVVPAAPLDGGRLLRAWLWKRHGDRARATRSAARAGVVFGQVLIGLGIFELWMGLGVGGLWSILLGWFVLGAARAEEAELALEQATHHVRVRDVMTPDPVTVPAATSVASLVDDYVLRYRCSAFPVTSPAGEVTGLATLTRARAVPRARRATLTAADIAWPASEVTRAGPNEPLWPVLRRAAGGDGRILVFEGARLAGIVSPSDIARLVQAAGPAGDRPGRAAA